MLIRFTIQNWMSFRDPVTFSMIATRERQHGERLVSLSRYRTRVLPFSAIYGGNASGKTAFFKALNFVRRFVIEPVSLKSLIPIDPYRLDEYSRNQPCMFEIEILVDDCVYAYHIEVTRNKVLRETLTEILGRTERILFDRSEKDTIFDERLLKEYGERLRFVAEGTQDNSLLLSNSVNQKIDAFRPQYSWFEKLIMIAPDAKFSQYKKLMNEEEPLSAMVSQYLRKLDTGVDHLGKERVEIGSIPEGVMDDLEPILAKKQSVRFAIGSKRYLALLEDDAPAVYKIHTFHKSEAGDNVSFDFDMESDGTKRLVDLVPAFSNLFCKDCNAVYIIDEIDRSLHTLLTRQIIETYLKTCSAAYRKQLLITTHDVLLMDQQLLRRDEMWVTERQPSGVSTLHSFAEYLSLRDDSDVQKIYLQGRMGGIPLLPIAEPSVLYDD